MRLSQNSPYFTIKSDDAYYLLESFHQGNYRDYPIHVYLFYNEFYQGNYMYKNYQNMFYNELVRITINLLHGLKYTHSGAKS